MIRAYHTLYGDIDADTLINGKVHGYLVLRPEVKVELPMSTVHLVLEKTGDHIWITDAIHGGWLYVDAQDKHRLKWPQYVSGKPPIMPGPALTIQIVATDRLKISRDDGHSVEVEMAGFAKWVSSKTAHIQDCLPNATNAEREFVLSGMTNEEFKKATDEPEGMDDIDTIGRQQL